MEAETMPYTKRQIKTSLTLIQRRNNVVCPVGGVGG